MSAKVDTPGIHASKTGSGRLACIVGANLNIKIHGMRDVSYDSHNSYNNK